MGNATSDEGGGGGQHDDPYDPFDGADTLGYRVLGVQPNSPASRAGLVSFLDFLVGANQQMLLGSGQDLEDGEEYDDVDLPNLLEQNKDRPVEFRRSHITLFSLSFTFGRTASHSSSLRAFAFCLALIPLLLGRPTGRARLFQWCTTSSRRSRASSSSPPATGGEGRGCWG
jgi:hypothetical protein